eukprot:CFRG6392T1
MGDEDVLFNLEDVQDEGSFSHASSDGRIPEDASASTPYNEKFRIQSHQRTIKKKKKTERISTNHSRTQKAQISPICTSVEPLIDPLMYDGHVVHEPVKRTLDDLLSDLVINVKAVRELVANAGLHRVQEHHRPLLWKILLGHLPADTKEWDAVLSESRCTYQRLLDDVIVLPTHEGASGMSDHPLNDEEDSKWSQFLNDNKLINTIHKDIRRISTEFEFIREWSKTPRPIPIPLHSRLESGVSQAGESYKVSALSTTLTAADVEKNNNPITDRATKMLEKPKKDRNCVDSDVEAGRGRDGERDKVGEGREKHWEIVERILFVYAKTNVGVGYVQGLTDLILPLYSTMAFARGATQNDSIAATTPNNKCADSNTAFTNTPNSTASSMTENMPYPHAEADTFFCFTMLMGGQRNNFIHALDDTELGISGLMLRVSKLLKAKDPELSTALEEKGLLPQYYLFQWLSLLFTRQFTVSGVVRVWDRLLCMKDPADLSVYMCVAMVVNLRHVLIPSDFSDAVTLLQNFHTNNPTRFIKFAYSMYRADDYGKHVLAVTKIASVSPKNNNRTIPVKARYGRGFTRSESVPDFGDSSASLNKNIPSTASDSAASAIAMTSGVMAGLRMGFSNNLTLASSKLTETALNAGQKLQMFASTATETYMNSNAIANARTDARRRGPGGKGTYFTRSNSTSNTGSVGGSARLNNTTGKVEKQNVDFSIGSSFERCKISPITCETGTRDHVYSNSKSRADKMDEWVSSDRIFNQATEMNCFSSLDGENTEDSDYVDFVRTPPDEVLFSFPLNLSGNGTEDECIPSYGQQ